MASKLVPSEYSSNAISALTHSKSRMLIPYLTGSAQASKPDGLAASASQQALPQMIRATIPRVEDKYDVALVFATEQRAN